MVAHDYGRAVALQLSPSFATKVEELPAQGGVLVAKSLELLLEHADAFGSDTEFCAKRCRA